MENRGKRINQNNPLNAFQENIENIDIILNSIKDAIIATDTHGNITRMNPAAERLTGYTSREVEHKTLNQLIRHIGSQTGEQPSTQEFDVFQHGKAIEFTDQTQLIAKNGTQFQIAITAAPLKNKEDNIIGMVLVCRDVMEDNTREVERNRIIALENLRVEIWKLAAQAFEEKSLIQDLLNTSGPGLGVENISYMPYNEGQKDVRVAMQWRADKQNIGLGERVPSWIFKAFIGKPYILFAVEDLPSLVKPVIKPFVKKYGTQSTLVVPYGDEQQPEGYLSAQTYTYKKNFTEKEIQVFIELVKIIHLKSKQLSSQKLLQLSESRYRNFFEHDISGNYLSTPKGKLLDCNPAFVKMLGYTSITEILQTNTAEFYPRSFNRPHFLHELTKNKSLSGFEFEMVRKDGRIIHCIENVVGIFNEVGDLIQFQGYIVDVTQRKQGDKALRESEERLNLALKGADLGLWDWKMQTGEVIFNHRWAEIVGYSSEEIDPHISGWEKLIHPADLPGVMDNLNAHLAGLTPYYESEHRLRAKDGSWKWIFDRGKVLEWDSKRKPLRIVGTHQDISDRKRTEETERKSIIRRQKEAEVVSNIAISNQLANGAIQELAVILTTAVSVALEIERVGVWLFDETETKLVSIDNYCAQSGTHSSGSVLLEHEFRHEFDVLKSVKYVDAQHPLTDSRTAGYVDGYIKPNGITALLDAVIRSAGRNLGVLCLEHVDKEHHWEDDEITFACQLADQVAMTILNNEDKKSQIALIESEGRLRTLIETIPYHVWLKDPDGVFMFCNKNFERFYGAREMEIVGKTDYDFVDRELADFFREKDIAASTAGKPTINEEIVTRADDGQKMHFETIKTAMYDSQGNLFGILGIAHDISERKREENVRAAQLRLIDYAVEHSVNELLQKFLDEAEELTDSEVGFYHFVEEDEVTLSLQSWSTNTRVNLCSVEDFETHYHLSRAGVWADCVKERRPLIHNDFTTLPNKKGMPEGHVKIQRELVVPVFRRNKIVAILGLGNKKTDYDDNDVRLVQQLADFAWETVARKQTEEALLRGEKRYRTLVERMLDGIYRSTPEGRFLEVNPAFVKILGYESKEEVLQLDIKKALYFDESERADVVDSLKKAGDEKVDAYRMRHKQGHEVWVEDHGRLICDEKGTVLYHEGVLRDITDRKKAEKIQNVLYNISCEAPNIPNLEDLIFFIKQELNRLINTTNFYIALHDEGTNKLNLPFFQDEKDHFTHFPERSLAHYVIRTGKSLFADLNKIKILEETGEIDKHISDTILWLGVPLHVKGKVTGALVVQSYNDKNAYNKTDIHTLEIISDQIGISIERNKAEQDLFHALAKAQESDRLKSAFLANMSHEIRTPMNGILGFSELLKEPNLRSEKQQEYIDVIERSGARMLNIINEIIDISKIESGQMTISISDVNINECLEECFGFFRPEAERKNIELKVTKTLQKKEALVKTDFDKLNGVLTNLIKNAIKYTNSGSIEMGYSLRKPKTEIEFYVKDTGIGIPVNRQIAIFDRFIQADIEDKMAQQGAGLGLAISRAYVEMLEGRLWVESEVNVGSTFYFTIPYKNDSMNEAETTIPVQEETNRQVSGFEKITVLIVEDDESVSVYLKALLNDICKEIHHAKTGFDAVEMCLTNENIDVVLMDIRMPGMNGYQATKKIREYNKDIIVIAQTAYALQGDREKALEAGCNDYIAKPFGKDKLLETISRNFKYECS